MSKKTILFVMHGLSAGGAERVVLNLVNNFDRDKFNVHLCLFNGTGILIKSLKDDVTLHNLNTPRVSRGVFKFTCLIHQLKPDFVFTSITHVNLLISLQIKFFKFFTKDTCFITREVNIPSVRAKYKNQSKLLDLIYKRTIKNYDYVIAQSNFMKRDLLESYNISKSKVHVVSNPLDINNINLKIKNISRCQLLSPKKINILAIGNLRKQKGFDILLEALPHLNDRIQLYILGEGPERNNLEAIIDRLGMKKKVTLLGFQDNPYKFMKQSDMVVLSSLYEGFPNVILESNACGKFVVAFECPGVSEEIINHDINGHLVKFGDIKAFSNAINMHSEIRHDEEKIIETTNRYHVKTIVNDYEKLILNES